METYDLYDTANSRVVYAQQMTRAEMEAANQRLRAEGSQCRWIKSNLDEIYPLEERMFLQEIGDELDPDMWQ